MAKIKEKEKALLMRKNGHSIGEIAKNLSVSKSTVSVWCRDIALSEKAIQKIAKKGKQRSVAGLMRYSESKRKMRLLATKRSMANGAQNLGSLTKRDIYCLGLGLYWGEGYKKGSQEFGFTNSDPDMIVFYIKWLRVVFGVKKQDLILRVSINSSHRARVPAVERYWSELTKVPLTQFTKTSLIKTASRKVYTNNDNHVGTLRVKVRCGTAMRREVMGAIKSIEI